MTPVDGIVTQRTADSVWRQAISNNYLVISDRQVCINKFERTRRAVSDEVLHSVFLHLQLMMLKHTEEISIRPTVCKFPRLSYRHIR